MKLNIGSGDFLLGDCINFDLKMHTNEERSLHTDVIGDARHLPFKEGSFSLVYLFHMIEHLDIYDGWDLITDIWRILKPGGVLFMEAPDVRKCAMNIKDDDIRLSHHLFGDPRLFHEKQGEYLHRSGWTLKLAEHVLKNLGFEIIKRGDGETHSRPWRDFLIWGKKCVSA